MPSTMPPISAPMRSFISRAALLVKVTARIWPGHALPVARICARRVVSTRVLPVPAPARTRRGPSSGQDRGALLGIEPLQIGRLAALERARDIAPGAKIGWRHIVIEIANVDWLRSHRDVILSGSHPYIAMDSA